MVNINLVMQDYERSLIDGRTPPAFRAGDTVIVSVKVREGSRERVQAFEGVVIARRNCGFNSSFTVRKISYGEGVERTFHLYSQHIAEIKVTRRGHVRRAKLYYLRGLTGKKARIKERIVRKHKPSAKAADAAKNVKSPVDAAPAAKKTAAKPAKAKKAAASSKPAEDKSS